jgi:CubicO group peptidase (beta-lactamase class C family)
MMLLVQDGTIGLDESVAKYLPEIKQLKWKEGSDSREITFRELASHTGGLAREPGLWNAAAGPIGEWENKVLRSIPTTDVTFPPGTKFSYSNIGYGILGPALSRAAHEPFMQMVENGIFKPLHMTSSFYIIPYGFGLNVIYPEDGSKIAGHDGSVAGYTAFMVFSPGSKVGAIVMRNCDYGGERIAGEVAKVVEGLAKVVGKSVS